MSVKTRRIIALVVMLAAAVAAMCLIDGRVMSTMARYADQPRSQGDLAVPDGSR